MADKTQIDNSARGSSSRESTPEEHGIGQPLSMDSLILSGESSDDILMDELEDEEEEIGSGEEEDDEDDDDEAMAAADTEAGSLEGVNGAADQSESIGGVGRTGSRESIKKQPASGEQQQQKQLTRNKKKRRVSTRQRKISISSRLKVNKCLH